VASFLLLIVCLGLGVLVARVGRPPEDLARHLNWWVLYIAFPALVLHYIPHLQFNMSLWFLFVGLWLTFAAWWWLGHQLGTRLGWSRGTIGAVVLTGGLSNTSFVGFALVEALRGKDALSYATIADQLGSFLMLTIGGALVVAMYTGGKTSSRSIARKIVLFPPFLALLLGFVVAATPGWPTAIEDVLARIGSTLVPLALFSVGLQLRVNLSAHHIAPMFACLSWKLGIAPALILGIGSALHIQPAMLAIAVLQNAMAPMITGAILAEQNDLDPPLANMMVGIGILASFITVPLWNLLV